MQVSRLTCLAHPSREQRHIGTLSASIGVQLVEHQELETCCPLHQWPLVDAGEDQLEHHVVGQENVGRVGDDRLTLLILLLPGVPLETDGLLTRRISIAQELLELTELRVCKGVHRIDDDRLDPLTAAVPQDAVDDWDDVAETLARSGSGRQHIVGPSSRGFDGIQLVTVKT